MNFNTIADFQNGISVTKSRGLKITGYIAYQVLVKTSTANLTNAENALIPVDVVKLQLTKYTSSSAGINTFTRSLSTTDQIVISNPMADYTHQVIEYDLRYFTNAGDERLRNNTGGTFSTNVLFVVIPQ